MSGSCWCRASSRSRGNLWTTSGSWRYRAMSRSRVILGWRQKLVVVNFDPFYELCPAHGGIELRPTPRDTWLKTSTPCNWLRPYLQVVFGSWWYKAMSCSRVILGWRLALACIRPYLWAMSGSWRCRAMSCSRAILGWRLVLTVVAFDLIWKLCPAYNNMNTNDHCCCLMNTNPLNACCLDP